MTGITIIGVDCAAQAKNTGLVWATQDGEVVVVREARCASSEASAAALVADWIEQSKRVLLALDAPLGWPSPLGKELALHRAGEPFRSDAHTLFRRLTDDEIYRRLRRRPLEVAADRIARAAHAALRLLGDLRERLTHPVPLVWSPQWRGRLGVIEVYPAATRLALGLAGGPGSLAGLESRVRFQGNLAPASEHARDAAVCGIAALEFMHGRAVAPTRRQRPIAQVEGWIWAGGAPPSPSAPSIRNKKSEDPRISGAHVKVEHGAEGDSDAIEARRQRFRPQQIRTLFIAESPPAGGTFFFDGNSKLYHHLKEAFSSMYGAQADFLHAFRRYGFFLDDLVHHPVNQLKNKADRIKERRKAIPALAARLRAYQPETVVTLMKEIEPMVSEALEQAGLLQVPRWGVPFPSPYHLNAFREQMKVILPQLPTSSDLRA